MRYYTNDSESGRRFQHQAVTYGPLFKAGADPATYILLVNGRPVRVRSAAQLVSHRRTRIAILEQADLVVPELEQDAWRDVLEQLADAMRARLSRRSA